MMFLMFKYTSNVNSLKYFFSLKEGILVFRGVKLILFLERSLGNFSVSFMLINNDF